MGGNKRNNALDFLRIISCISVVIIHTNAHYFVGNSTPPEKFTDSTYYIIQSLLNIITRFCVPCFVMISGAFLLGNKSNADFRSFYQKSLYKIFLPMFPIALTLYSLLFYKKVILEHDYRVTLDILVGNCFTYWFMYMLLFIYALVPFIIRVKQTVSPFIFKCASYSLMIWAIISHIVSPQYNGISMGMVFSFVAYFMIGSVVYDETRKKKTNPTRYIIIALIAYVITFWVRFNGYSYYLFDLYLYFSPTIVVSSVAVFKVFCLMKINKDFSSTANKTYYIYLFHYVVMVVVFKVIDTISKEHILNIIVSSVLTILISWVGAILYMKVYSAIIKRIVPFEKWKSMNIWNIFNKEDTRVVYGADNS